MSEKAIFTALPAGRAPDGRLQVTVFVTPRLIPAAGDDRLTRDAYPAFGNWAETVHGAAWVFDVDGDLVDARPNAAGLSPDPHLWAELFDGVRVAGARFQDFSRAVVDSYPVDVVVDVVHTLYRRVAVESPLRHPPITTGVLADAVERLHAPLRAGSRAFPETPFDGHGGREGALQRRVIRERLAALRVGGKPAVQTGGAPGPGRYTTMHTVSDPQRPAVGLALAGRFYDRADEPGTPPVEPPATLPDFHSFVARCADFPDMLRLLGLAIDLTMEDPLHGDRRVELRVARAGGTDALDRLVGPEIARPRTRTHRTDHVWAPASRPDEPDIIDGSLALGDDDRSDIARFTVDQLDPDGAALKLIGLLDTLARTGRALTDRRRTVAAPSMTDDASSIPALRSTGIIIARNDRAAAMVRQFDRSAQHEATLGSDTPTVFDATDVTRGWRVDVRDGNSSAWRSLHRRIVDYGDLGGGNDTVSHDEGYLKAASMSSPGAAPSDEQYLHETLAGWDGWSLAATRPGKPVDAAGAVSPDELIAAETGFRLAPVIRVEPGTLPRLRFGRRYDVRVRAVDLSGRSIPDEQLDDAHVHRMPLAYQRWEPIPSPVVLPLTQYTEGESLMRMVIRSTAGVTVDDYLALPRVRDIPGHTAAAATAGDPDGLTAGPGIVYRAANLRHLAAPIGSVQLAETHGMLDTAFDDPVAGPSTVFDIVRREADSFLTASGAVAVDPSTGAVRQGPWAKDETLDPGWYLLRPERRQSLPYLPDPLARGVALTGLPGEPAGTPRRDVDRRTRMLRWPADRHQSDWTDRQPVVLRIVEGAGAPSYDEASRTLTVQLPKATTATVRLSSFLDDADIELMRVWQLIDGDPSAPATDAQRTDVREGRHWMITPFTELTLVHAVEMPLEPPQILPRARSARAAGETFSPLVGVVHSHAASSGRVDITAEWDDPVDDVNAPAPKDEHRDAPVGDFTVAADEDDAVIDRDDGFRTQRPPVLRPSFGPMPGAGRGLAGTTVAVHGMRHEFGDTRHHVVSYTATATTRFREYFPASVVDDPRLTTVTGPSVDVDVPSSARPAVPVVRYVVPYWEWHSVSLPVEDAPFAVHRTRSAGGLRVYLDRPWYSSGAGELLGVVLSRAPAVLLEPGIALDGAARADLSAWSRQVVEDVGRGAAVSAVIADRAAALTRRRLARRSVTKPSRAAGAAGRFAAATARVLDDLRFDVLRVTASARLAAAGGLIDTVAPVGRTGDAGRRFTTVWGADPVFELGAGVAGGPYAFHFPRATAVGTVRLAELDDLVTVAGHLPQFDHERRLWYCDIEMDAGDAYMPFVRLALARYQPSSVEHVELSPVVIADFAQQLPRRDAGYVVTPDGRAVAISVQGPVGVPQHAVTVQDAAARIAASRRLEAWVERMPHDGAGDLDWHRVAEPTVLAAHAAARGDGGAGTARWYGTVALPEASRGERLRIQLAEYEVHQGDDVAAPLMATGRRRPVRGLRLVYADTVELPGALSAGGGR